VHKADAKKGKVKCILVQSLPGMPSFDHGNSLLSTDLGPKSMFNFSITKLYNPEIKDNKTSSIAKTSTTETVKEALKDSEEWN
jgi:hypothetical protein